MMKEKSAIGAEIDENTVGLANKFEKVTMGVQHCGKISLKEATNVLREFWPKYDF